MADDLEIAMEFDSSEPLTSALPQFMTIVLLFGAAVKGANREERKALYAARELLKDKAPLRDVAQAILDSRGPRWAPPQETMDAIEKINRKDTE
jgi:hypothetical protein